MEHQEFYQRQAALRALAMIVSMVGSALGLAGSDKWSPRVVASSQGSGFYSIDLGEHTVSRVRSATGSGGSYLVASNYDGMLLGVGFDGSLLWENKLSGFMNRDIWCADLNGDGLDEVLAANANGTLYCLGSKGELLWEFKRNDAPMNSVCVIRDGCENYVVCGGYDKCIYYLSPGGGLVKTVASSAYSIEKPWGKGRGKRLPPANQHVANFIRPIRSDGGEEVLLVHGMIYSNSSTGTVYLFKPLAEKPFQTIRKLAGSAGDLTTCDVNDDGIDELLFGSSSMIQDANIGWYDLKTDEERNLKPADFRRKIDGFGYRVAQSVEINDGGNPRILTSFGSRIILSDPDLNIRNSEPIKVGYSFNDMWKDEGSGRVLLASAQSGGSCIHVIDPSKPGWKEALADFQPAGKLKLILENTADARKQLESFEAPSWERAPLPVYMMSEPLTGGVGKLARSLEAEFASPVFLNHDHFGKAENWDRSGIANEEYRNKRDRRRNYTLSQDQALELFKPLYLTDHKGVSFWGGHGNDPYMFSAETMMKVVDAAKGKKSVFIYPELEDYGKGFEYVLDHHIYPMAEHFKSRNGMIYVRTKHAFWQSIVYMPLWSRLLSGEFSDVFIPAMEETTDKTMEQSLAGRLGIWTSGATDQWGARGARDNPSFDRLRQHSHQMIPNHFLRALVYNVSYGATYLDNFPVDREYFSILYELIAKGALYVPKRDEILSFSPVHLSMTAPDPLYLDEGNNAKWISFFDEDFEKANPMVFSRLNGSWPGAPITEWDFSRYAAGVKDRRLNFIPPYENGVVLITPPQDGVFAAKNPPRGWLADHLHPLYRDILKEYVTDGRDYISSDGKRRYLANEFHKIIEADIQESSKLLPLTVTGEVGWVVAQTSPTHLRLTLIDSGYINPKERQASVHFQCAKPVKMTDLLSGEVLDMEDPVSVSVTVPCGLFRFVDIELEEPMGSGR